MSPFERNTLDSAVVPVAAELCAIGCTLSMYDLYSSWVLLPWQEPTQKTRPTTTAIASATKPASLRERDGSRRRRSGTPRPAGALRPHSPSLPLGRLERLRLLEELELRSVVESAHLGRKPNRAREGQSDRVANLHSCMGEAAPELTGIELVLDRYRPLRPLGSGGSGSVWLARDERTGLDVALKMIAREGKAAARAEREAAGRGAAAPSRLSPRERLRPRLPPRLHRVRVRPRPDVPRGAARRRAQRRGGDRGVRAGLRRPRPRAWRRNPPP